MSKIKWVFALLTLVAVISIIYYQKEISAENNSENVAPTKVKVNKKYREDGTLKADVEVVDGVRNGVAHNYYPNGKVHSEINYRQDIKHGISTWYYADGKPYRITPFENGKKHGNQKKYYESGKLMAEIPFVKGEIQEGTKEYWEMGKEIEKYPELVINNANGICYVSFNPKVRKSSYFAKVKKSDGSIKVKAASNGDENFLDLRKYSTEEISVYAEYKTDRGNLKLVSKKIQ